VKQPRARATGMTYFSPRLPAGRPATTTTTTATAAVLRRAPLSECSPVFTLSFYRGRLVTQPVLNKVLFRDGY